MNKEYRKFIEKTLGHLSSNPDDREVSLALAKGIEMREYMEDFFKLFDEYREKAFNEKIKPKIKYDEESLQKLVDIIIPIIKRDIYKSFYNYDKLSIFTGIYITKAIEEMDEEEIVLELRYPIDDIGFDLRKDKKIIVKGNVGYDTGSWMKDGEVIVEGDAKDHTGEFMYFGKIVINGNVGDTTGLSMKDGKIVINGNVGNNVGYEMEGGEIYIKNLDISKISKNAKKGRIYRGVPGDAELVWEDGKLVEHKENKKIIEHKDIIKMNVPEINQIIDSWARYNPDNVIEMFRKHMSREPNENELKIIENIQRKYNDKEVKNYENS